MPAVTADALTLPRLKALPEKDDAMAAGRGRRDGARAQLEGEGFVVRRPFPSYELSMADPFLLLDHLGAVEYAPGEAKGTPWHPHRGFETVTYIIDGALRAPGHDGRRRADHRWRDAVDDGGRRHPAHRAAAGVARREGRPVPRRAALGEPAGRAEVDAAALPGHRGARRRSCCRTTTAHRWCESSRARWTGTQGPGVTQTPITYLHATVAPGSWLHAAVAARLQRARVRARGQWLRGHRAAAARGGAARGVRCGRCDRDPRGRRGSRRRRRTAGRCWCSAACRSASRSRATARS